MPKKITKALIIVIIAIGIYLIYKLALLKDSKLEDVQSTPEESSAQASEFKEVKPGSTSKSEVVEKLGTPVEETEKDSYDVLEFESNNPNFNNEVYIESNEAKFIKQIVVKGDEISASDIIRKYNTKEYVLYNHSSISGINLYVLPESGIAYIGHASSETVFEIWYFEPATFEDFKQKWAPNYTEEYKPQPEGMGQF